MGQSEPFMWDNHKSKILINGSFGNTPSHVDGGLSAQKDANPAIPNSSGACPESGVDIDPLLLQMYT